MSQELSTRNLFRYSGALRLSLFEAFFLRLHEDQIHYLMSFFNIDTIALLEKVSHTLRGICRLYCSVSWSFSALIREWFLEPSGFQDIMYACSAVLSGSLALQYFARKYYPSGDMDLYVKVDRVEPLGCWIIGQGYTFSDDTAALNCRNPRTEILKYEPDRGMGETSTTKTILAVFNFSKNVVGKDFIVRHRRVQIIVVDVDPIYYILFHFHSTAVMNFITAHEAVCVFPRSTLLENVSYINNARAATRIHGDWAKKYTERGYRVAGKELISVLPGPYYGRRFTTDSQCWNIHFKPGAYLHRLSLNETMNVAIPFEVLPVLPEKEMDNGFLHIIEPPA